MVKLRIISDLHYDAGLNKSEEFDKQSGEMIEFPKGKSGSYNIPDTVTIIDLFDFPEPLLHLFR